MQFIIFVALAAFAIHGSSNRFKAMRFVVGSTLLGALVGGVTGYVAATAQGGNAPGAAGSLTGAIGILVGIVVSIKQILDNRKVPVSIQ
jgi:hypothetical protein